MLATRISFMNEIANLCERVGANVDLVRKGIGSDSRIGPAFLFPGPGYGGSCFPKDVKALVKTARDNATCLRVLEAVEDVNDEQKHRLFQKLQQAIGPELRGKRVAVWGLAFKPNTDDMREATSLVLSARLQAAGAHVSAYDPIAEGEARRMMPGLEFADDTLGCVRDADAVVLVTEWEEFRTMDLGKIAAAMAGNVLIDGRNALDPAAVRAAGLIYEGIGQG